VKSSAQIKAMRAAGLVVADVLRTLREAAAPGVTTAELDQLARERIAAAGAVSSFLDRKSTRLNSSHNSESRMPSSA
jgi:methionyl aminopeptidase